MERTLVLIKPEGVKRKMVGRILQRFEDATLTIDEMKLMVASKELVEKHYPNDKAWTTLVGEKTLGTYKQYGVNAKKELGTEDAYEIGKKVKGWLVDYISSGPIVAMVISGNHAVDNVRKLVGSTIPLNAAPGTIRGDFSVDSPDLANGEKRPVQNLIHASGTVDEAEKEITLWFPSKKK
jgi:nucleoside-diphosphate kinase